jgi:hypothetical protein
MHDVVNSNLLSFIQTNKNKEWEQIYIKKKREKRVGTNNTCNSRFEYGVYIKLNILYFESYILCNIYVN